MRARPVLLSLTIVLAVVGLGAFILQVGAGNLVGSGQAFAEKSAVSTLRTIHWAQGLFRKGGWIDEDGNGVGEFGTMGQLSGEESTPSGKRLDAPLTPPSATLGEGGILEAGGYCFRVDLPDGAHARERRFIAWAWPRAAGAGTKMYCLDQDEQIYEAEAGPHIGCDEAPPVRPCPPEPSFVRWRGKVNKRPVGVVD